MYIDGKIIRVEDGYVYIKQFYSGCVYKAKVQHVKVSKDDKTVGRVDGLENFTCVKAPWIKK